MEHLGIYLEANITTNILGLPPGAADSRKEQKMHSGIPMWRFTRRGSGRWVQYRAQARDEVSGRAERMVTPRCAAWATWNSQCGGCMGLGRGQGWGKYKRYCRVEGRGAEQTEGMVTPRCAASATWNPHVQVAWF